MYHHNTHMQVNVRTHTCTLPPLVGEQDREDFHIVTLDGPLQWSAALGVLGVRVGVVVQQLAGYVGHALAGPGGTLDRHRGHCGECLGRGGDEGRGEEGRRSGKGRGGGEKRKGGREGGRSVGREKIKQV